LGLGSLEKGVKSDEQSLPSSEARSNDRYERVTSRAKTDAVLRLLKGESIEGLSMELGISAQRIERWKDRFVAAGSAELGRRKTDPSKGWLAQHSSSILQWIWLLIALVAVISFLVVFMQRGSPD
jgi:hypothetical protein